jgi:hypothetical protein
VPPGEGSQVEALGEPARVRLRNLEDGSRGDLLPDEASVAIALSSMTKRLELEVHRVMSWKPSRMTWMGSMSGEPVS